MHVAEGVGAAGDHHHDHRRSDLQELVQQLRLHPWKPEVLGVAPLAGRAVAEQAGEVADDGHAEVGRAGGGERGLEAGPVLSLHRAALLVDELGTWQLRRQGIDHGLHLEPQPETRVARQHMVGEGVAAHDTCGSAAQGPTTATRLGAGRPSPSNGSADPASSRTTDRSAISLARARLAGESRSVAAAPATEPSGVQSASSSPSCTFCVRSRRAARSTRASGSSPRRTRSTRPGPKPMVSGSSTSMPAASAWAPASSVSAATRCMVARNGTAQ